MIQLCLCQGFRSEFAWILINTGLVLERGIKARLSWKSEMQYWVHETLHLMLVPYPDGIILEPFVGTGQQSEMDISEGWDSRNRSRRRKSGLHGLPVG